MTLFCYSNSLTRWSDAFLKNNNSVSLDCMLLNAFSVVHGKCLFFFFFYTITQPNWIRYSPGYSATPCNLLSLFCQTLCGKRKHHISCSCVCVGQVLKYLAVKSQKQTFVNGAVKAVWFIERWIIAAGLIKKCFDSYRHCLFGDRMH